MLEMNNIHQMNALEGLKQLPDECVDCVITSPPYWGLRDYGVVGQIGLEPTPEAYVGKLVEVFRQVHRVLRDHGTLWLNLGDSYNGSGGVSSLKPKDLVGIPWRVALALQADGWYLRSDIIWSKPNPMPESVRDRPTRSHEYLFLLTKSPRYFYDTEAVKEVVTGNAHGRGNGINPKAALSNPSLSRNRPRQNAGFSAAVRNLVERRNLRSVWSLATQPYAGAHFATFPEKLVEPCIKAGTSEKGCCPKCGAAWEREVRRYRKATRPAKNNRRDPTGKANRDPRRHVTATRTVGWKPACQCDGNHPRPCIVLDAFIGSGTTAIVATAMGRNFIGFELNAKYVKLAKARLKPLMHNKHKEVMARGCSAGRC